MMSELVAEPVFGLFKARRFCRQGPFGLVLDFCLGNIDPSTQVISSACGYWKGSAQQPNKK